MIAAATSGLCFSQALLYARNGWGLHSMAGSMLRTPDGFSRELRASHAELMTRAIADRRALQQMLPRSAPNDPPALPGAA